MVCQRPRCCRGVIEGGHQAGECRVGRRDPDGLGGPPGEQIVQSPPRGAPRPVPRGRKPGRPRRRAGRPDEPLEVRGEHRRVRLFRGDAEQDTSAHRAGQLPHLSVQIPCTVLRPPGRHGGGHLQQGRHVAGQRSPGQRGPQSAPCLAVAVPGEVEQRMAEQVVHQRGVEHLQVAAFGREELAQPLPGTDQHGLHAVHRHPEHRPVPVVALVQDAERVGVEAVGRVPWG